MRRLIPLASSLLLLALILGLGRYLYLQRAAANRLAAWQAEQTNDAPEKKALERLITLEGGSLPLADFAELIRRESGLPVVLDHATIENADSRGRKLADMPVYLPRGTLAIHAALRITLEPQQLWFDVTPQQVSITTSAASDDRSRLTTVVYPLPDPGSMEFNETSWKQLIYGNLPPFPGSRGQRYHVEAVPGALIVVGSVEGHRRVREVLDAIARLGEIPPTDRPRIIPPPPQSEMEARIAAALDQSTSLEFVEQPLRDVILYLADKHNIPVILMANKIEAASVSPDTPITKYLKNISLRSALHLMLSELELTFVHRDGILLITTPEDAAWQKTTTAYPIHDLLTAATDGDAAAFSLVFSFPFPDLWANLYDAGSTPGHWLVVSAGPEWHHHVATTLDHLRRLLASDPSANPPRPLSFSPADDKLRAALDQPLTFESRSLPLKDAILFFQESLQVPFVFVMKRLEEASVSSDTPVTGKFTDVPARDALTALLKPLELTYVIREEVIQITTPEDAEGQLVTRLYDARNLTTDLQSQRDLCDQLTKTIFPRTWASVGGPGTIAPFRGILIITQTQHVHDQIEQHLRKHQP